MKITPPKSTPKKVIQPDPIAQSFKESPVQKQPLKRKEIKKDEGLSWWVYALGALAIAGVAASGGGGGDSGGSSSSNNPSTTTNSDGNSDTTSDVEITW